MYNVSESYINAIRKKTVSDSISGTVTLANGNTIEITDENLVKDSLRLTKELCGEQYAIGSFNLSHLEFSIFIDNALGIDLTGATVSLTYGLKINDSSFENVPLGTFVIDPVLSVRQRDVLRIDAYDIGIRADAPPSQTILDMNCKPAELIAAVCAECGIDTDIEADSLDGFPNSSVTVSPNGKQIQSCRDIIMWCSALLCGYAVIDRNSKLVIIPAKYSTDESDSSVIVTARTIREDERDSISVTDTRAYIKYLTAYSGDKVTNYTSSYVSEDEQASPAAYALEKNPLLAGKSESECDSINRAWLSFIDGFKQRGIKARIFSDPSIDPGDTVMFRGGDVDQRRGVVGVVTSVEWKYRGFQVLTCTAPECVGSLLSGGVPSCASAKTRSQTSKRIDGLDIGSGGGVGLNVGRHNEIFNSYDGRNANTIENASGNDYNHCAGFNNSISSSLACYADGYGNSITGSYYCVNLSSYNTITGSRDSLVTGTGNTMNNSECCYVSGNSITVDASYFSQFCGISNKANSCKRSILAGSWLNVNCENSFIVGDNIKNRNTDGSSRNSRIEHSVVSGLSNDIKGIVLRSIISGAQHNIGDNSNDYFSLSALFGTDNTAKNADACLIFGRQNTVTNARECLIGGKGATVNNTSMRIVIGGASDYGNVFTVDDIGNVHAAGTITPNGADYAEYFEWLDGNPENEDRRGMLVALDGDKIVPATGNGFFGIVSSAPSIVGNSAELCWNGKYRKDVFGSVLKNDDGEPLISENYDSKTEYIPRSQRREWAAVGLVGRLVVTDDGSCKAGDHITARNGTASVTRSATRARVLRRIDETHIEVLLK